MTDELKGVIETAKEEERANVLSEVLELARDSLVEDMTLQEFCRRLTASINDEPRAEVKP